MDHGSNVRRSQAGTRHALKPLTLQKPALLTVLDDAQLAHQAGDFVNALKFYEQFFDQSRQQDPVAYYGIRLSHCLNGWAQLAQQFEGAKRALETKKRSALEQFNNTHQGEWFHDYLCICRHLGVESDALDVFLQWHANEPKTAAKLSKFLWNDLINAEQWQVCNDLLEQANLKLDELFAVFDEAVKLKQHEPSFNSPEFDQHIVETLLDDVQKLVMVLRYGERQQDIRALERQFQQNVANREHSLLNKSAHAKASFLFISH